MESTFIINESEGNRKTQNGAATPRNEKNGSLKFRATRYYKKYIMGVNFAKRRMARAEEK
jgi:hypothetical protein